jgi:hypothetical protein
MRPADAVEREIELRTHPEPVKQEWEFCAVPGPAIRTMNGLLVSRLSSCMPLLEAATLRVDRAADAVRQDRPEKQGPGCLHRVVGARVPGRHEESANLASR